MTPDISENYTPEARERSSHSEIREPSTVTREVRVAETVVINARSKKQEQLHELADKSGSDILDALKSSSDAIDVQAGLAQFVNMADDTMEVAIDESVPKPGEQVQDELAKTVTRYKTVKVPANAVRDELGRSYATGKRKDAVARVWIKPGSGKITVNGKELKSYFARPVLQMVLSQPFTVAGVEGQFDVMATVKGGSLSGQAGAVKHGISKALQLYDPSHRAALKAAGFLTRDSRVVERKKYGRAKARKSFQFSKR